MRSAPDELSTTLVADARVRRLPRRRHPLRVPGRRRHCGARTAPLDRHRGRRGRQRAAVRGGPRGGATRRTVAAGHRQHAGRVRRGAAHRGDRGGLRQPAGAWCSCAASAAPSAGVDPADDRGRPPSSAEALVVPAAFLPTGRHGGPDRRRSRGLAHDRRPGRRDRTPDSSAPTPPRHIAALWPAETLEQLRQVQRTLGPGQRLPAELQQRSLSARPCGRHVAEPGPLGADRGVVAVAGVHDRRRRAARTASPGSTPRSGRSSLNDRPVAPGPALEEGVAGEDAAEVGRVEADRAGRVARACAAPAASCRRPRSACPSARSTSHR